MIASTNGNAGNRINKKEYLTAKQIAKTLNISVRNAQLLIHRMSKLGYDAHKMKGVGLRVAEEDFLKYLETIKIRENNNHKKNE